MCFVAKTSCIADSEESAAATRALRNPDAGDSDGVRAQVVLLSLSALHTRVRWTWLVNVE